LEPRISIITLGVKNLAQSYAFYKDGLGFPTTWEVERGIIFFKTTGTCLALYPLEKLADDIGPEFAANEQKFSGITLAHNVPEKSEVDQILELAAKAGGKIEKPAEEAFWGGYSGYFSDPDGYLWEVAFGAFEFNDDGSLKIT